ncbi:secretoglobin family 1D member 2-like [Mesocricetus auratus]|uniref:Uteroglobin n=2 Tax=Mesocricetus auratus TaxID=10036 RepID=A0ABM2WCP2_MESAU|nr:secretoglobin family 1D member 2-like [Mesocricetus auratus]
MYKYPWSLGALVDSIGSSFAKSENKLSTMKLFLCLLLVILAIHCYEANAARVCPSVVAVNNAFLFTNQKEFQSHIKKFNAPAEAVEAKMEVKKCVDSSMNDAQKAEMEKIMAEVVSYCKQKEQ